MVYIQVCLDSNPENHFQGFTLFEEICCTSIDVVIPSFWTSLEVVPGQYEFVPNLRFRIEDYHTPVIISFLNAKIQINVKDSDGNESRLVLASGTLIVNDLIDVFDETIDDVTFFDKTGVVVFARSGFKESD